FACGYSASRHFVGTQFNAPGGDKSRPYPLPSHPFVKADLKNAHVLDLSVGSTQLGGFDEMWQRMTVKHEPAIGGYNETRVLSPSSIFRVDGNDGPEWRTVHLGIDIFLPPGSPVLAPLDGHVHSFRNNSGALDYGPTLVLQ